MTNKISTSALLSMPKLLTVWTTTDSGKFLREGNTRRPDLPLEKSTQVRKQQSELDMELQIGSKQEKEFIKAVYCHLAYLTYMRSTS